MSELENLVPDLELCKRIPKGAFADSALIWSRRPVYHAPHEWVIPRNHAAEVRDICPAPTLQEIMRALPESVEYQFFNGKFLPCHPKFDEENFADEKPENAALKLWLGLNNQKGKG